MPEFTKLEDLRREATTGHKDLQGWRFRAALSNDDTSTVLAWAADDACVIHEAQCAHIPADPPTATSRMDDARALFAVEQPKGTVRYFDFCGHCLTERIPNFGWEPTERDLTLLATMKQVLNDVRVLSGRPIPRAEVMKRMARYGESVKPTELRRLVDHYKQERDEDEPDLSTLIAK